MKTIQSRFSRRSGNTLVLALMLCALVGLILLTYLQLIQGRTKVRARSQSWNTAIPVLEAGVEEALAHLHNDSLILTSNSWNRSSSGATVVYTKRREFSDGSYCLITISNVPTLPFTSPVIYSQGFAPAPFNQG